MCEDEKWRERWSLAKRYRGPLINNQFSFNTENKKLWRNLDFLQLPKPKWKSAVLTHALSKGIRVQMNKKHTSSDVKMATDRG